MPRWSDFGEIWNTVRELDVGAIREEAERPVMIVCVGNDPALAEVSRLLHSGPDRYPLSGSSPLTLFSLPEAAEKIDTIRQASMVIMAVDARQSLTSTETETFNQIETLAIPYLVTMVYGGRLPDTSATLPPLASVRALALTEPTTPDAPDRLASALLARLPSELHLATARRLPGIRAAYARDLIASVSFSNATYAFTSGLPEQVPIISVPFAAADMFILTKNQAMMVYRLALAYGAPPIFQDRIREVLPVVGSAFLWRQAARSLIGLIPIWGLLPKVAVAYAGTYTTGTAALRWYAGGELISGDQLKKISADALAIGRERGAELIARTREAGTRAGTRARDGGSGLINWLRQRLPFRRKQHTPTE